MSNVSHFIKAITTVWKPSEIQTVPLLANYVLRQMEDEVTDEDLCLLT